MGAGLLEDPIAPQEEPLYQAAEDQIPEEQVVYQESAVYEERAASAYDNYEEQEQQAIVAAQRSLVPSIPEDAPVFTGPVYNLESYDNLPAPLESHQHMEQIEGNPDDPFAPTRYRLVTTHILPPLMVYAPPTNPIRERPIRKRVAKKAWDAPLGEVCAAVPGLRYWLPQDVHLSGLFCNGHEVLRPKFVVHWQWTADGG